MQFPGCRYGTCFDGLISFLFSLVLFSVSKEFGEPVVILRGVSKHYSLPGRTEVVTALKKMDLTPETDFQPIRRYELQIER